MFGDYGRDNLPKHYSLTLFRLDLAQLLLIANESDPLLSFGKKDELLLFISGTVTLEQIFPNLDFSDGKVKELATSLKDTVSFCSGAEMGSIKDLTLKTLTKKWGFVEKREGLRNLQPIKTFLVIPK